MPPKVLVVGSVNGQLTKAFTKIAKLHSKQGFAFCLIVGDLFTAAVPQNAEIASSDLQQKHDLDVQALLAGQINVPLPMYFTLGSSSLPEAIITRLQEQDNIVTDNLRYLGRKGQLTTSDGIKIVFLGGQAVSNEESLTQGIDAYTPLHLENEARVLQGNNSAHILLTTQWPTNIESGSSLPLPDTNKIALSSPAIANLCATLKPRYHFSPLAGGSGEKYAREPFMYPAPHDDPAATPSVVRFEALADVNAPVSAWCSAFTLDISTPPSTEGVQRRAPFSFSPGGGKRKRDNVDIRPIRYDDADRERGYTDGRGRNGKRDRKRQKKAFDPIDCFMCLGKETFDTSMVISIGNESFMTSLRGPLSKSESFPQLTSSGNLMIIPLYHAADEVAHGARNPEERQREFQEMTRYRHALQHMLQQLNADGGSSGLGAICWEVNRTGIRHFHWQWIACLESLIHQGLVDAAFKIAAEHAGHAQFQPCNPDQLIAERTSDYFRVWIWSSKAMTAVEKADAIANGDESGEKETTETYTQCPPNSTESSMYFELPNDQRFNIQFGRTVMAGLLKLEDRADWRAVPMQPGDEARDAEAWKADFGAFDFAMAEG